jgi:2-polyprenyl-6-methoxyphenol hydroxylase-like FAD-dependent oxidoreductase
MAGLLAARVLADHFGRVTIVERDALPEGPAFRKGVPQSRFPHVLLPGGLAALRRLFPEIVEELVSLGAVPYLWPRDALWLTANRRRHYEGLRRLPERFLVTGDAACAFNPVYGQGMSVAAGEAEALDRCLREQRLRSPDGTLAGLARRFQKEVARSHAGAWQIVSGEDLRYPTAEGAGRGLPTRLGHRYFDRVVRAAMKDGSANRAFVDVMGLMAPPSSLFRPSVLLRALALGGSEGTRDAADPPSSAGRPEPHTAILRGPAGARDLPRETGVRKPS